MSLILTKDSEWGEIECEDCDLCKTRKNIVWGEGSMESPFMFIAEAPGRHEDQQGYPLVEWAKSGEEYTHLLSINGLRRENVFTTNLLKCRPPGDKDPKPEQIKACSKWLTVELNIVKPRIIGTIGRFSTRHFLGNVDMERVHGIPFKVNDWIIIPLYHPAAGLRDPNVMMCVQQDFKTFADVAKGKCAPRYLEDPLAGREVYTEVTSGSQIEGFLYRYGDQAAKIISVDTESGENDALWSVQLTVDPGEAIMVMADNTEGMAVIAKYLARPDVLTLLHNALWDLPQLAQAHIYPAKHACSMVMAYLLQSEPQGLKPLAFRHAGMEMKSYKEMIRGASEEFALTYLLKVIAYDWRAPSPVLEWKKEKPHVKQPQNIKKKAQRIISDFADINKDVDIRERWHHITLEEGRAPVEDLLGPMPEAYLSDIPHDEAVHYADRDPDATLRIYPYLWEAIQTRGLEGTFWRDMGAMPMVVDMMREGIKANPEHFKELSKYFDTRMKEIERDITHETGQSLNIASFDQVAKLLFDHLKIPKIKGRSTDASVLARSVDAHPVVQMIRDWRSYQKLKNTYADQIPKKIQADGRVHATFRITRTSTGRLCVDPDTTYIEMPRDMNKYPKGKLLRDVKKGDFVYSFDWKRELCVKKVKWIGPTKTTKTVRIVYQAKKENSPIQELIVSPDHLVRLYSGQWKYAGDLKCGERLLCMTERHNHGQGYYSFFPHSRNRANGIKGGGKVKEHRFIFSQIHDISLSTKNIIHHKDKNPLNNAFENLQLLESITVHQRAHEYSTEELEQAVCTGIGKRGEFLARDTIQRYKRRLWQRKNPEYVYIPGQNHIIIHIEEGPIKQLWDMEIEDTHCFIGNEVALHNSSANPNLQAQPVKGEEGPKIREGFVAADGCYIVSNDYCLTGDTKVITEYGEQSIKDITVGTGVLSSMDGKTLTFENVNAAAKIGEHPAPVFELELEDGSKVQCTEDHPWMLYNGEKCLTKDLQRGDSLAHVKEGRRGRYPTWYLRSNRNYFTKHVLTAQYKYGLCAPGFEVDHINSDIENWNSNNIRYLPIPENRAQGGRRYWRDVKNGERSDDNRLQALRVGLKKRRTYEGEENPNYGKFNRDYLGCPVCGKPFSKPKSHNAIYCSHSCYSKAKTTREIRTCPVCDKQFLPKKQNTVYCSRDCYNNRELNHKVKSITYVGLRDIFQITVDNTHTFVLANGLVSFQSQIEMRVTAHDSQDPTMIRIFRDDKDIHTITAASVWGIPEQDIDEMKHRYPVKRVGFGILYDITAYGLHRTFQQEGITQWSQDDCQRIIDEWFKVYPGVKEYMKQIKLHARRYGYVRDFLGRIRYIPGARAANKYVQAEALRMAGNAPIQMGAQGIIKQAMGNLVPVYKDFRTVGTLNPLIQIHDDLVFEMAKIFLGTVNPVIRKVMEEAITLRVPVKVDTKYGETWGTMKKWEKKNTN